MTRSQRAPQQDRAPGLLSLPRTRLGRWSARLLLLSFLLILLNSAAIMPFTEQRGGLDLLQTVFNVAVGLSLVSAGICGAVAWITKAERSWVVVLSMLLLVVLLGMMLQDLATGG